MGGRGGAPNLAAYHNSPHVTAMSAGMEFEKGTVMSTGRFTVCVMTAAVAAVFLGGPAAAQSPSPPPPPPPVTVQNVSYCVVHDGRLHTVTVQYNPATGDTTYNGQPLEGYPAPGYAGGETWFIDNEPVMFNGRRYVKYGLPRRLGAGDVKNVGTVHGVSVFAEPDASARRSEVIYVPIRPGCEFQSYQTEINVGAVRGG